MLRSEGHVQAHLYPVWKVWDESEIVKKRINRQNRTLTSMMVVASATAQGGKKATKALKEFMENFSDGEGD